MEKLKISIIIPVYNAEEFLPKCLESILEQSYQNYETIIINDGSTDNSLSIAEKYTKLDSRFHLFSKTNGGVSTARNYGITMSTGNFLCFVDADDTISSNFLEILSKNGSVNFDCTAGGIRYTDKKQTIINIEKQTYTSITLGHLLSQYLQSMYFLSACGKLYKSSIIKENNIRFNEFLKLGEDTLFLHTYLSYCKTFHSTGEIIYIYQTESFSFVKYQLKPTEALYAINKLTNIYCSLCQKFKFQNNIYFQFIVRHYMLSYQQYTYKNVIYYNDIKALYKNKNVKETFSFRKNFSRFNRIQYILIQRKLYILSFIICRLQNKIIV